MASPEVAADEQSRLLSRYGRRFAAGDVLFQDGDPATEAFLLQEGRVRLIKRVGAVERGLRVLRPGDFFGEAALVPGAPRNSTAVALDDGAALALDPATFQQVLTANPTVGTRVLSQVIRRLRDAEDQIEILMLRDSQSKIVVALLKLAQQSLGATGRQDGSASLSVSPMDLSARVGLDVDTVKRSVQELRDAGYVRIVEERVEVTDLLALRELFGLIGLKEQIAGGATAGEGPRGRRNARQ
jgi:CRP/FNR family transcriptional regulator, cyclic AMP receptor protein